jgi:two-component system, cell cycle sensor histidine kinase and response regulator CckA
MRLKRISPREPSAAERSTAGAAVAQTPAISGTRPAAARRRRVLLVEDEDMVRKVITRMLTARGFQVHTAANGAQAMALFDQEGFEVDLLITDLMMPETGGHVLARQLSERFSSLKVLFVSGYSASEADGYAQTRHRFLTKPFGSSELANAIDELFLEE